MEARMPVREQEYNGTPWLPWSRLLPPAARVDDENRRPERPAGAHHRRRGVCWCCHRRGVVMVNPNEGRVLRPFGDTGHGTRTRTVLGHPFLSKRQAAARAQLRELAPQGQRQRRQSDRDRVGRRVEGRDTAEAVFEVDDYEHYVRVQVKAAPATRHELRLRRP
jgi:hypothetical protein